MQSKFHEVCVVSALLLWLATIVTGIFYQQEFLYWVSITPVHMILAGVVIIFLCVILVSLLQGFKSCPETKDCGDSFRGLSHSRMKKQKILDK